MTPDDVMDERLRAAGDRLRATAPSPETTEAALDELRERPGALRRLWWVLPTGLVAAAAATIGVLALTGGEDKAVQLLPAETPPATAPGPPAATTTTTGTTDAPTTVPGAPAFVGDLPLDASASIIGCRGTFGDLATAVPQEQWPLTEMNCLGAPRPLPPAWLVADGSYRRGEDATEQLLGLGVSSPPDEFPDALGRALAAINPGEIPHYATEELAGVPVVVVTLTGIPDDSSSRVDYVVRYADAEGVRSPTDGLLFTYCDRGVAVDESGEPLDLCL
jgi:hypothetical protein